MVVNDFSINTYPTLTFTWKKIIIQDATLEKGLKILPFFKNFETNIFIFEYFPKLHSVKKSPHPFHDIVIPNTPYVKKLLNFLYGGPKNLFFSYCPIIAEVFFSYDKKSLRGRRTAPPHRLRVKTISIQKHVI